MNFFLKIFLALTVIVIVLLGFQVYLYFETLPPLHIAVVGPMTGPDSDNGQAFVKGARLCLEEFNNKGGILGRQLVLDVYDDKNNPVLALEKAEEISQHNQALAVIGHNNSACSLAGGKIYKKYEIPAITPSSTAPTITEDNPWYFRAIYSDTTESEFIANYIDKILKQNEVAIVVQKDVYGTNLAHLFEEHCAALGIKIVHRFNLDNGSNSDSNFRAIANAIQQAKYQGLVFIATEVNEGAALLKHMRDFNLKNKCVVPSGFASNSFVSKFNGLPKEEYIPGYYTNDVQTCAPFLFDNAGEKAAIFKEDYQKKYQTEPGWREASSYDAVLMILSALEKTEFFEDMQLIRKKIRDNLAAITASNPVLGVTGTNYFDRDRNFPRQVYFANFLRKQLISSPLQFQKIAAAEVLERKEESLGKKSVPQREFYRIGSNYYHPTKVVYIGTSLINIKDVKIESRECVLSFNLWLRAIEEINIKDFVFLNALEEVEIEKPRERFVVENYIYSLYSCKGRFKMHPRSKDNLYESLGFSIINQKNTKDEMLLLTDLVGLAMQTTTNQQLKEELPTGWTIENPLYFQTIFRRNIEGNPLYFKLKKSVGSHSEFNFLMHLQENYFLFKNINAFEFSRPIAIACAIIIFLLIFFRKHSVIASYPRSIWLVTFLASLMLLSSLKTIMQQFYFPSLRPEHIKIATIIFDCLWWMVPTIYLSLALHIFVWTPLEQWNKKSVPIIVKLFFYFLIYSIAFACIASFVFNLQITGLLATSGVIAMILGLAIQVNLSNVISGIALHAEQTFKVGDWVKIGTEEAPFQVLDIGWRAVRLMKNDGTTLHIPNNKVGESAIINYHEPDDTYNLVIKFYVDISYSPKRVLKIAQDALLSIDFASDSGVRFFGYTDWGTSEYLAFVLTKDYANVYREKSKIYVHLWETLHKAGIRQGIRVQESYANAGTKKCGEKLNDKISVLNWVGITRVLPDEVKAYLADGMRFHFVQAGTNIVNQGDEGNSLFIIFEGVVEVKTKTSSGKKLVLGRLGAGNFLGEMALLTGQQRSATVTAVTDTSLFEISKEQMTEVIKKDPKTIDLLSHALAERELERRKREKKFENEESHEEAYKNVFSMVKAFFGSPVTEQSIEVDPKILERRKILNQIELTRTFSDEIKNFLAERMIEHVFLAGETIVAEGEGGNSLFIIAEGTVEAKQTVKSGKETSLGRMKAGRFFGEMALFTGAPRSATVTAITKAKVFEIAKTHIQEMIRFNPNVLDVLGNVIAQRMIQKQIRNAGIDQEESQIEAYNRVFNLVKNFLS